MIVLTLLSLFSEIKHSYSYSYSYSYKMAYKNKILCKLLLGSLLSVPQMWNVPCSNLSVLRCIVLLCTWPFNGTVTDMKKLRIASSINEDVYACVPTGENFPLIHQFTASFIYYRLILKYNLKWIFLKLYSWRQN